VVFEKTIFGERKILSPAHDAQWSSKFILYSRIAQTATVLPYIYLYNIALALYSVFYLNDKNTANWFAF
jgi:hypothetical protein